ncbi:MAG: MucR family transcriptional regulator [Parvibaculum sp.]
MPSENDGPLIPATLRYASEIVSAYVSNNTLPIDELPAAIRTIYDVLVALDEGQNGHPPSIGPAVPVEESITDEFLICLEDGKKLKMLKRYLRSRFGLTPEEYKAKWGLPVDYPMVAPNYAAQRSSLAKKIGLGQSGTPRKR